MEPSTTGGGEPYELEVVEVIDETPDARSFVLAVRAELRETFRYQAGQFLTFDVRLESGGHRRCYSMSSSPETDASIKFTVKRVPGGPVSNWFNENVCPGTRLAVLAPSGRFVLTDSRAPLPFVAGSSGITPIISPIKTALFRTERRMMLLYANRSRESIIFAKELERLTERRRKGQFDEGPAALTRQPIRVLLLDRILRLREIRRHAKVTSSSSSSTPGSTAAVSTP